MHLYRAMGIDEFKKFISGYKIEGRGTLERKYVCFMPETANAVPISWIRNRWETDIAKVPVSQIQKSDFENTENPPLKINGQDAFQSLEGIVNSQLYIDFEISDDKIKELIKNGTARMQYCRYTDDGLGQGNHNPQNLIFIEEFQTQEYSSLDMKIDEISLIGKYGAMSSLKGLSDDDICKICDAQVTAPLICYDKDNDLAFFMIAPEELTKEYIRSLPDKTLFVYTSFYGDTTIAIKPWFSSQSYVDDEIRHELRKMAYKEFDTVIFSQNGFSVKQNDKFDRDIQKAFEIIQRIYKYKEVTPPKEIEEFFTRTVPSAKTCMSSEYLSSLMAIKTDETIFIPVGYCSENLFKDTAVQKIVTGEKIIENLLTASKITTIGNNEVKETTPKELLTKADIKLNGKEIETEETNPAILQNPEVLDK